MIGSMPLRLAMSPCCVRYSPIVMAFAFGLGCSPLWAQEQTDDRRPFAIEPYVSVTETLTDNNNLTTSNRQSESITRPTLGVRASADSAHLKGYLDYSLSGLVYGRGTARNELLNALSAFGTAELVENRAFIDLGGNISQQALSAFGQLAPDSSVANSNRVEVSTFSASPYVRGRLGSAAAYEARLSYSSTRTNSSAASDSSTASGRLRVNGATALSLVNWLAELSHVETDFTEGRRTDADVGRGVLTWIATPQLRVSAIGGAENNNYVGLERQSHSLVGFGVDWRPSERAAISVQRERRFFGSSHAVTFAYRTPRSAWTYSDVRDVSSTPAQSGVIGVGGTNFEIVDRLFADTYPDPVSRRPFVDAFFQGQSALDPNQQAFASFIRSALTVQRVQNLSFALLGLRNTVTLAALQTETRQLDQVVLASQDFNSASLIKQRGLSAEWAHRLTPLATLSLLAGYERTTGSLDTQDASLRSLGGRWTTRLGRRTNLSLGARHARFTSATSPYRESAAFGTLEVKY